LFPDCPYATIPRNGDFQAMSDDKGTETPQAIERAGHKNWERVVLGENGISGTIRLVVYIAGFALLFGSIFYFFR
jgi:hypothetical protein